MSHHEKSPYLSPPTRESFAAFCRLLYERHLVVGVGGHVSARFEDGFLVTPSGMSLRDVDCDSVMFVKGDSDVVQSAEVSKEFKMHLGIFNARPDVNVVCHVHGSYIVAASAILPPGPETLPPLAPGFAYFACPLPMLPFHVPGSAELAEAVGDEFRNSDRRALLLKNHGLRTVGATMAEALNIAEEVDEAAMVFVLTSGKASFISNGDIGRLF